MAKKANPADGEVLDYRHDKAKRKNNPPAGLAAQGRLQERARKQYAYNPHLPPAPPLRLHWRSR